MTATISIRRRNNLGGVESLVVSHHSSGIALITLTADEPYNGRQRDNFPGWTGLQGLPHATLHMNYVGGYQASAILKAKGVTILDNQDDNLGAHIHVPAGELPKALRLLGGFTEEDIRKIEAWQKEAAGLRARYLETLTDADRFALLNEARQPAANFRSIQEKVQAILNREEREPTAPRKL